MATPRRRVQARRRSFLTQLLLPLFTSRLVVTHAPAQPRISRKSSLYFFDDEKLKRPLPPLGFMPWPTKRGMAGLCPVCKCSNAMWSGGNWVDPKAQEAWEKGKARGIILMGALDPSVSYEGEPILNHPSRYGSGGCLRCGTDFWHDFVGRYWRHYYSVSLFGASPCS